MSAANQASWLNGDITIIPNRHYIVMDGGLSYAAGPTEMMIIAEVMTIAIEWAFFAIMLRDTGIKWWKLGLFCIIANAITLIVGLTLFQYFPPRYGW